MGMFKDGDFEMALESVRDKTFLGLGFQEVG